MDALPPPEFHRAFQYGLGRALSQLRNRRDEPSARAVVLDGLLHARTFDPQVEGTRREYLLQAWELLGQQAELTELIASELASLHDVDERHWDVTQMIDLLVGLAHRGETRAADVLRAAYEKHSGENDTFWELLAGGLIELDGIAGLVRVLRDQARLTLNDLKRGDRDYINHARHALGDEVVEAALPGILKAEPLVARYVQAVQALKDQRQAARQATQAAHPRRSDAYEAIWEYIRHARAQPRPPRVLPRQYTADLSSAHVARLVYDLAATEDVTGLRLLLAALGEFTVPEGLDRFLELQRHPDSLISYRATGALSRLSHPSVRSRALELLQGAPENRSEAVRLLTSNVHAADVKPLRHTLRELIAEGDENWLHNYGSDLNDLVRAHPMPALLNLLADAFPHQPCTNCRGRTLDVLTEHGAVPEWLVAEAALDASENIRQKFAYPAP